MYVCNVKLSWQWQCDTRSVFLRRAGRAKSLVSCLSSKYQTVLSNNNSAATYLSDIQNKQIAAEQWALGHLSFPVCS